MNASRVHIDAVAAQPWRNGGGLTRELLAWPSPEHWVIRISVADVAANGPFSRFAATQRWFAVLEGGGVELTVDGIAQHVRRGDPPACFSGEAATTCRLLDGPTRDLNLMLRNATGGMQRVDDGSAWRPEASQCGLFAAVSGRCSADRRSFDVTAGSLLWFAPAPDALLFVSREGRRESPGWWIAATPRESGR